jgi:hypothetical protein
MHAGILTDLAGRDGMVDRLGIYAWQLESLDTAGHSAGWTTLTLVDVLAQLVIGQIVKLFGHVRI